MSMLGGRCRAQEGGTCRPLFRQKPDDPSWLVTSRSLASSLVSWPPSSSPVWRQCASSREVSSLHSCQRPCAAPVYLSYNGTPRPDTIGNCTVVVEERFRGITIGQKSPQEEAGLETNTVGLLCVFGLPQPASFC